MNAEREHLVKLAQHLRRDPLAVNQSPEDLALATGIPLSVVKQSLGARVAGPESPTAARRQSFGSGWRELLRRFGEALDRLENLSPWLFFVTVAIGVAGLGIASQNDLKMTLPVIFGLATGLIMVLVQLGLCFRFAKVRWAVRLGITAFVIMSSAALLLFFFDTDRRSDGVRPLFGMLMLQMALLFVSVVYTGIASVACLLGAMVRFRREDLHSQNLSRQQLLDRVFQIEEALATTTELVPPKPPVVAFEWLRRHQIWMAALGGMVIAIMTTVITAAGKFVPEGGAGRTPPNAAIIMIFVALLTVGLIFHPLVSFAGGNLVGAVRNSLIYSLASNLGTLIVWGISRAGMIPKIPDLLDPARQWPNSYVSGLVMSLVIGLAAGLGAHVQLRTEQSRRRQLNDPQMLMSELVDIQRRLSPTSGRIYVMSVDAAKSSQMKANGDAFTAEWSFRAYQHLLQEIVEGNGGSIHSTQGDGAIALFRRAEDAFVAARLIQTRIADFNQNVNRLKDPFRLRIGLHSDTVGGDLTEVQFSASIDVAAHVEGEAPVGGIAVTAPVIEELTGERFAMISTPVDGFSVGIALNPVMDPEEA